MKTHISLCLEWFYEISLFRGVMFSLVGTNYYDTVRKLDLLQITLHQLHFIHSVISGQR